MFFFQNDIISVRLPEQKVSTELWNISVAIFVLIWYASFWSISLQIQHIHKFVRNYISCAIPLHCIFCSVWSIKNALHLKSIPTFKWVPDPRKKLQIIFELSSLCEKQRRDFAVFSFAIALRIRVMSTSIADCKNMLVLTRDTAWENRWINKRKHCLSRALEIPATQTHLIFFLI